MPSYKILKPTPLPTPGALANLAGGRLAKASPIGTALHNQDRLNWHGRRVILQAGGYGAQRWRIPDTDPDGTVSQKYPESDHEVTVARALVTLAPGYVPYCKVMALPSGACQKFDAGTSSWIADDVPAYGAIRVTAIYDGGTYSAVRLITPPVSTATYYAQPSGAGKAWGAIDESLVDLKPAQYDTSLTVQAGMYLASCEITVVYIGSPRVIDLVVFEQPGIAVVSKTDAAFQPAHFYTDGNGAKYPKYPHPYPVQLLNSIDDPTGGSYDALQSIEGQQGFLGPLLVQWSHWVESTGPAVSEPFQTETATTFADMHEPNYTLLTYGEDNAGWTTSSASYARVFASSEDSLVMRGVDGVIAVRVRVFASFSGGVGNYGVVRVQTSISSWIDVTVTGSGDWYGATGYLRCGTSAEDVTVLRLFGKVVSSGTLSLKAICIEPSSPP